MYSKFPASSAAFRSVSILCEPPQWQPATRICGAYLIATCWCECCHLRCILMLDSPEAVLWTCTRSSTFERFSLFNPSSSSPKWWKSEQSSSMKSFSTHQIRMFSAAITVCYISRWELWSKTFVKNEQILPLSISQKVCVGKEEVTYTAGNRKYYNTLTTLPSSRSLLWLTNSCKKGFHSSCEWWLPFQGSFN